MISTLVLAAVLATSQPLDIAHRGASASAPENTIAAFQAAARQHADLFEIDVQETKDHKLVLVHDPTLSRTTNVESVFPGRTRVSSLTLAQIRRLDAGAWFSGRFRGERVPTLDETLRAMDSSGLGLLLEIKNPDLYPGIERRIAASLRANPSWLEPGRLIVQSFSWSSARTFHRALPGVPIALLGTPSVSALPRLAEYAGYINVPAGNVTAGYVRQIHANRMKVFAWTVDSPDTMRRLTDDQVDGIVTNRPDVLAR